ncbi:hypothetical protein ACHAWF_015553 [Thalassiosira exigua]
MDQFVKDVEGIVAPNLDKDAVHPYDRLEKAKVLQDARIFHDSILVRENPLKCCRILAQILYMQNDPKSTSKLTNTEATELFFASTKLFVDAEDVSLRRLVYLFIKEMQPLCDPSDVIIVTSCLTRDMTSDVGVYRANAIRVLVNIIDSAMLGSIERYIKQAIVDNDMHVSNSALVSASHLYEQSTDNATIVRRWVGEVQEMVMKRSDRKTGITSNNMVQVNALRLLCQMKSRDRLGMAKLVQKFGGEAGKRIQSPLAIVMLIRLCGKLMLKELTNGSTVRDVRASSPLGSICFNFLESSLSHKNAMVSYEAARTICMLPNLEPQNLTRVMQCLHDMLLSDRPASRFAALRTLSLVQNHSRAVALCNEGLEKCVHDGNKQISTMAIAIILQTGSEAVIERMLSKLPVLLDDVQDEEYKTSLIQSLEALCLKYPSKHRSIVTFLASLLRDDAEFGVKCSIVDCIVSLMKQVPEMKESSLLHLCEFIEDCEYSTLSTQTIHIIAEHGPTTRAPAQYIRFLYNRVILDSPSTRAAAVQALSKFAAAVPSLRSSIVVLLRSSLHDEDDETRDRSSIAVAVLNEAMALNPYIPPVGDDYDEATDSPSEGDVAAFVYIQPLEMNFDCIERSIKAYISTPASNSGDPLTFSALPCIGDSGNASKETNTGLSLTNGLDGTEAHPVLHNPAAAVYAIPEFSTFGNVFRSTAPVALTEDETEYVVSCIKHILDEHIILQFIIQNTVEDQRLEDCTVALEFETDSDYYRIIGDVQADMVEYGKSVSTFSLVERNPAASMDAVSIICQLNFTAVHVDPDTSELLDEGHAEEYPLESVLVTPADYMMGVSVPDFRASWNGTDDSSESLGKYQMQPKSLDEAVSSLIELSGMMPCDGTERISCSARDKKQHMMHLSGMYVGGHEVLARAQLTGRPGEGVLLKFAIRSDDKSVSEEVLKNMF